MEDLAVQLVLIRGMIASLSDEEQVHIKACATRLREVLKDYEDVGGYALALLGAEMAAGEGSR